MDIVTQKYLRKPLIVEAVQVTAENFAAVAKWCQGEIRSAQTNEAPVLTHEDELNALGCYISVRVHNPKTPRQTKAYVGDWLLYTERGYKIYNQRAFSASFEIAPDANGVQAVKKQVG